MVADYITENPRFWMNFLPSVSYLKGLIETLHHTNPLSRLFGELARLHLESLHLMVEFTLVYISLGNSRKQKTTIRNSKLLLEHENKASCITSYVGMSVYICI